MTLHLFDLVKFAREIVSREERAPVCRRVCFDGSLKIRVAFLNIAILGSQYSSVDVAQCFIENDAMLLCHAGGTINLGNR